MDQSNFDAYDKALLEGKSRTEIVKLIRQVEQLDKLPKDEAEMLLKLRTRLLFSDAYRKSLESKDMVRISCMRASCLMDLVNDQSDEDGMWYAKAEFELRDQFKLNDSIFT
jgi:hypothetical protein